MLETGRCPNHRYSTNVIPRRVVPGLVILLLLGVTGCGWIFSKQKKPMKVEVVFVSSDSLNFDGTNFQPVQVKAYILTSDERFLAADVRAFFDPAYDAGFVAEFNKDVLGTVTTIIAPGEESTPQTIEIPFIRVNDEKPIFAAIANFAQPPRERNRERIAFGIKKKSKQQVRVRLGTNWVEKGE